MVSEISMEYYSNIAGDTLYISLSLFLSLSFPLSLPSLSPFHRVWYKTSEIWLLWLHHSIRTRISQLLPDRLSENLTSSFADLEGGKFFFNTVREGDSVLFATEDEQVGGADLFCTVLCCVFYTVLSRSPTTGWWLSTEQQVRPTSPPLPCPPAPTRTSTRTGTPTRRGSTGWRSTSRPTPSSSIMLFSSKSFSPSAWTGGSPIPSLPW